MTTILGFIRFVAGVALSLFAGALEIILLPLDRRTGRLFHAVARTWARLILFICGVRVKVSGLEKLDRSSNYVYASNHASMFDIPCVLAGIPDQIRIIFKKELEKIPFFGWGLKWGHYISVDRSSTSSAIQSLAEASRKIRDGASVLLYAEGTRTTDGRLQAFKRGAFKLALESGVPVVPLTINGSYSIVRRRSLVICPGVVHLILEDPISLEGMQGKEAELALLERVRSAISKNYIDQSTV